MNRKLDNCAMSMKCSFSDFKSDYMPKHIIHYNCMLRYAKILFEYNKIQKTQNNDKDKICFINNSETNITLTFSI